MEMNCRCWSCDGADKEERTTGHEVAPCCSFPHLRPLTPASLLLPPLPFLTSTAQTRLQIVSRDLEQHPTRRAAEDEAVGTGKGRGSWQGRGWREEKAAARRD